MTLEALPTDRHPSPLEVEAVWFARQPQPPGAPTVDRDSADLLEIGTHIEGCAQCASQLVELEQDRTQFLQEMPALALPDPASSPAVRLVIALAAVLVLGVFIGWFTRATAIDEPRLRAKGGDSAVAVMVASDAGWVAIQGALQAGDEVRFSTRLPAPGYPLLVVEQEDGQRAVAYPASTDQPLVPAGQVLLAGSARLDDYAGRERVLLWVGDTPWSAGDLANAGSDLGSAESTTPLRNGD